MKVISRARGLGCGALGFLGGPVGGNGPACLLSDQASFELNTPLFSSSTKYCISTSHALASEQEALVPHLSQNETRHANSC